MEVKLYLRMLLRKWWLILAALLVTLVPTVVLVNRQPVVYEASSSYVIHPVATVGNADDEFVDAVDTLARRPEINTTFAEIADSRVIKQRAIERLGLSPEEQRGVKVNGKIIAGTNILEIEVEGPNPAVVSALADAVGAEVVSYVNDIYNVFELEVLDTASMPNRPTGPAKTLTLVLGAAFGLLLGVGLVFLIEYLNEPLPTDPQFNIIDQDTGVYNAAYFRERISQELSRSGHNGQPFSLALIKINRRSFLNSTPQPFQTVKPSPHLAAIIKSEIREEDVLAYLGNHTFALLLPDMTGQATRTKLAEVQTRIDTLAPDSDSASAGVLLYSSIGISSYLGGDVTEDELLDWTYDVLEQAGNDPQRRVVLSARKSNLQFSLLHSGRPDYGTPS